MPKRAPQPAALAGDRTAIHRTRILARYPNLTDDHLRYLRKWGLVGPAPAIAGPPPPTASPICEASPGERGSRRRTFLPGHRARLLADSHGQLALDFQSDPSPAKVIRLQPRSCTRRHGDGRRVTAGTRGAVRREVVPPEQIFLEASALDDGRARDGSSVRPRATAMRSGAIPSLVPALINLGNVHYTRGDLIEAQALYEKAIATRRRSSSRRTSISATSARSRALRRRVHVVP